MLTQPCSIISIT